MKAVPVHWPPYITTTGHRADSTDSTHYYGPASKSSHRGHIEMHGCAPGFSGFLTAPLIHLLRAKKRKSRNCDCLCSAPAVWAMVYLFIYLFFCIGDRQKLVKRLRGAERLHIWWCWQDKSNTYTANLSFWLIKFCFFMYSFYFCCCLTQMVRQG